MMLSMYLLASIRKIHCPSEGDRSDFHSVKRGRIILRAHMYYRPWKRVPKDSQAGSRYGCQNTWVMVSTIPGYDSSIPAFHSLSNTFILLLNDKTQVVEEAFIKKAFFDTLFAEEQWGSAKLSVNCRSILSSGKVISSLKIFFITCSLFLIT